MHSSIPLADWLLYLRSRCQTIQRSVLTPVLGVYVSTFPCDVCVCVRPSGVCGGPGTLAAVRVCRCLLVGLRVMVLGPRDVVPE